jgi:phosphomannomutase
MSLMISVSGVRGVVGPELNPSVIARWAVAFGSLLGDGPVVVGRDSRPSGGSLSRAAAAFLSGTGREVFDAGIVPTPTVQLAVERWGAAGGLILTASHNPAEWNALKFVDRDGSFFSPDRFALLRGQVDAPQEGFVGASAYGGVRERHDDAVRLHREAVLGIVDQDRIRRASLRVALECGHGAGGELLASLAKKLDVGLELFGGEPDGALPPNPEPTTATLTELLQRVSGRPSIVAMVDPDADRLGLALPGTIFTGEEWTLPLIVRHRLEKDRGPLVTNLSTSTRIEATAQRHGVPVFRTPVGEAHVVAEMRRRDALIGGEGNGGVIDPRAHLGRDSAVAFGLLCEAEAVQPGGLRGLAEEFPPRYILKEKIKVSEDRLAGLGRRLEEAFGPAEDRRDGFRWGYPDGFLHVRASNTEPVVRAVAESSEEGESRNRLAQVRATLGVG